ncbi:hypothetical protein J5N97_023908 [Dioscorea zingiberensis]|uniref:ACB domain-containing protein n=1 Tax=Dioscorea zingiberensis TaxID=325984 RepID=A0A9D5H8A0_9LILI|nr:hypothetical protein J5N97_023908 [Dioscorea zingiberensis]
MEFYGDLLLSVAISIVVALLIVAISAILDLEHRAEEKRAAVVDLGVDEKLKGSGRESEGEIGEMGEDQISACVGNAEVLEFERVRVGEEAIEESEEIRAGELDLEVKSFEVVEGVEGGWGEGKKKLEEKEEEGSRMDLEDEWEGVERSEVVKRFGVATKYAASVDGGMAISKLRSDVRMRLYGFRKVAVEGPCYEPQPMALKISARAKWQAWQRLGNMNPEVAMEQYITLLSESIPGWMGQTAREAADKQDGSDSPVPGQSIAGKLDAASPLHSKLSSETNRNPEDCIREYEGNVVSEYFGHGLPKTFLFNLLSPTSVRFLNLLW